MKRLLHSKLRTYFLTGLVVLGPIGLTILVVQWIVTAMDDLLLNFLPQRFHPEALIGMHIPGLGVLATLILILIVGIFTANYFGKTALHLSEKLVYKIPLVKGIYTLFKQVADTIFRENRQGFRKVVLIEYPRRGIWVVGFVTGVTEGELQAVTEHRLLNIFVPTTPNPTSGFYVLVPEQDAVELKMTVEEAFKLVVSGGMVSPPTPEGLQNIQIASTEDVNEL